jgi:hypothetical protein
MHIPLKGPETVPAPAGDVAAQDRAARPDCLQVGVLIGRGDVHEVGIERGRAGGRVRPPGQQGLRIAARVQHHRGMGIFHPG